MSIIIIESFFLFFNVLVILELIQINETLVYLNEIQRKKSIFIPCCFINSGYEMSRLIKKGNLVLSTKSIM